MSLSDMGLDDISHSIGRLDSKMDSLLETHGRLHERLDRYDLRLQQLEKHNSYVIGVAAAIAGFIAVGVDFVRARFF
jgi:hypothetical protein